jgi:hypothetical protein
MKNETTNDKNRPAHEVRYGGIKAVIWRNATSNGVMHNVTLARLYKEGDEWRETSGFNTEDLPVIAKLAYDVHTWIHANTERKPAAESKTAPT